MPQTKPRITFGSPPEPRNRAIVDGLVKIEQLTKLHPEEKN